MTDKRRIRTRSGRMWILFALVCVSMHAIPSLVSRATMLTTVILFLQVRVPQMTLDALVTTERLQADVTDPLAGHRLVEATV